MAPGEKGDAQAPLELPQWWPGATGTARFPTDDSLAESARALRGHLDALELAMRNLHSEGLVTAGDLGGWDAGQELAGTVKTAHQHISALYADFQNQLSEAAQLLVRSGEGHKEAEHVTAKAVRRLGADAPLTTPSAHPTRRGTPSMD